MLTLPNIDITFKALAAGAVSRSKTGTAILIAIGEDAPAQVKIYKSIADVDSAYYSSIDGGTGTIYREIADVFRSAVDTLYVFTEKSGAQLSSYILPEILLTVDPCWIALSSTAYSLQDELCAWIKSREMNREYYKAVVCGATSPDSKHIVNIGNKGTFTMSDGGEASCNELTGILLGMLASVGVNGGITNAVVPGVKKVEAESLTAENALERGEILLVNSRGGVRICVGINSSTSVTPEDLRYIENVEVCDLISTDITGVFNNSYKGKVKNSYDNQMMLISSVNGYLNELRSENVLDEEYGSSVDINIAAQRNAWISAGVSEAAEWSDDKVRTTPFKRSVFISGDIKILGCIDSLKFEISLA